MWTLKRQTRPVERTRLIIPPDPVLPPLHTHHSLMTDIVTEQHPWGTAGAPKEG